MFKYMPKLALTNSRYVLLDQEDEVLLQCMSWCLANNGYMTAYVPGSGRKNVKHVLMHEVVLRRMYGDRPKNMLADHINRNKLDNRRTNLRWVTCVENSWNHSGYSKSGFKGVERSAAKRERYCAYIRGPHKKKLHLGSFNTAEEAARAYDIAALAYGASTAYLNFPEDINGRTG